MKEILHPFFSKNVFQSSPPIPSLSISHPDCIFIPRSHSHQNKDIQCITTKKKSSPSPLMAVAMTTAINLTVLLHSTQKECLNSYILLPTVPCSPASFFSADQGASHRSIHEDSRGYCNTITSRKLVLS